MDSQKPNGEESVDDDISTTNHATELHRKSLP